MGEDPIAGVRRAALQSRASRRDRGTDSLSDGLWRRVGVAPCGAPAAVLEAPERPESQRFLRRLLATRAP
jgi:hypothetical protein